jgi:hypothetical protein
VTIFTNWVCYDGKVGVTEAGDYFELCSGVLLKKEVHAGALYYRAVGSKKRYSWRKCNRTKILKRIEIIKLPF